MKQRAWELFVQTGLVQAYNFYKGVQEREDVSDPSRPGHSKR